eukprot:CAMPEP_0202443102 /NCGR_PEP_ID=MMETSP1360-20130828/2454_1 /ASSEMBLY_ACC=CAM_ASM_000848 /TAXON_ID=515479 /ORGANISM="Licmophora paradoxa, Strain CCMP2313" /LENGTH=101 /DNA_ID=CAMNT_0049058691 /DNA_START=439 /DNA_END=740 /DNA_ORIENTATION=+
MPVPSTNDLILSSLLDIRDALKHPAPASPVEVLNDTPNKELNQITEILTNIVRQRTELESTKKNVRQESATQQTPNTIPHVPPERIPRHPEETVPPVRVLT